MFGILIFSLFVFNITEGSTFNFEWQKGSGVIFAIYMFKSSISEYLSAAVCSS